MATALPTYVDLLFPLVGGDVPLDHGYALYGAVSRLVPWAHGEQAKQSNLGIFPIRGTSAGRGTLRLHDRSALRIRLPADHLPKFLPLAGKPLHLDAHTLRVGVPTVQALDPAPTLASPLILIKLADAGHKDIGGIVPPETFLEAARRKLAEMNIQAHPALPLNKTGPHANQPRRRVIRVKNQTHVGYAVLVEGLTAEESILLQQQGLGGRRTMGCGLFLPVMGGEP